MLLCCFFFQGFSPLFRFVSFRFVKMWKRLRGQVREVVRLSEAVLWPRPNSLFRSHSRKMGYFCQLAKNSSLLPSQKKFGTRGREGEGREWVGNFFPTLDGSSMGPRLSIVIASASSVHPTSILSGENSPKITLNSKFCADFDTLDGKGSYFARQNHFAIFCQHFVLPKKKYQKNSLQNAN